MKWLLAPLLPAVGWLVTIATVIDHRLFWTWIISLIVLGVYADMRRGKHRADQFDDRRYPSEERREELIRKIREGGD